MTDLLDADAATLTAAFERAKQHLPMQRVHDLARLFLAMGWPSEDAYDTAWNGLAGLRLLAEIERKDQT